MRRGFSLIELVTALTLMGLVTGLVAPGVGRWRNRQVVHQSAAEAAAFYAAARFGALLRGSRVRIEMRPDSLLAFYEAATDSLFLRRLGPSRDGVTLTATRQTIRILPNGLGAGGSNTTLVFRRGEFAESLTTSRLGRLKRWK